LPVVSIVPSEVGMEMTNSVLDTRYMRSNGSTIAAPKVLNSDAVNIDVQEGVYERFLLFTFVIGILTLVACPAVSQQSQDKSMANMPGMDMGGDMKDMGPSMAAMAHHMYVTPLRPRQPGDEEKAKAVVAQVKAAIERYRDYHKALADGFVIANPNVNEPQFHFTKAANVLEAEHHFDPTKPSSLLYFQTPNQRYKLEGVMFTVPPTATEDELNDRIPLSIVRWHQHVKFCAAPADRVKEYLGKHPKFGMFGSIDTAEACKAEGGTFYPHVMTWMIHVFPFEEDLKDVFSMNDDVPHFGTEHP
jgi:hypothetical protein